MKYKVLLTVFSISCSFACHSQVGINTTTPNAELEILSTGNTITTKAFSVVNSDGTVLLSVFDNGNVKINSLSAGGTVIADNNGNLLIGNSSTIGDIKYSMLVNDHSGWVKLDGRNISTLGNIQQSNASLLGFTTNLPNANGTVLMQNGSTPGTINGSMNKTLTQANLPSINFPTAVTSTDGDHTHSHNASGNPGSYGLIKRSTGGQNNTGQYFDSGGSGNEPDLISTPSSLSINSNGRHSHTVTVSSGGNNTPLDITPKSLSVNVFIYLGN